MHLIAILHSLASILSLPFGSTPGAPTLGTDEARGRRRLVAHWHANFSAVNCSQWRDWFDDAELNKDDKPGKEFQKQCGIACSTLEREVEKKSYDRATETAICVCEAHSERPFTPGDRKEFPYDGPRCAIAGLNDVHNPAADCICHPDQNAEWWSFLVTFVLWCLLGCLCIECTGCSVLLCCCWLSTDNSVDVMEEDIHMCRNLTCSKTCGGGAFCCISAAHMHPLQHSKMQLILLTLLDVFLYYSLNLPAGIGIVSLAGCAAQDSSDRRRGWYVVGFTYIAAYCVVLIGYLTILGAPFALVVWIAMRWMYFRTIVSILRLPCKQVYVERYLSGAMHHGPMREEPEFGPARVDPLAGPYPMASIVSTPQVDALPQASYPQVYAQAYATQQQPTEVVAQAQIVEAFPAATYQEAGAAHGGVVKSGYPVPGYV